MVHIQLLDIHKLRKNVMIEKLKPIVQVSTGVATVVGGALACTSGVGCAAGGLP